ncbi:uncharacterized protein LOC135486902 [Lineus longissimus]|uniref:uncharacterized protein LOC135486902 n=1 Tax=Lineus longissimus TaxID=88925 RepID=UPI00315C9D94
MPKSEEWSKRAWKWQKEILQKLKWSNERGVFYTLEELMEFGIEWPKMIMPEEGLLGDGESVSFCAGEALVGLGVRSFKRFAACPWEECYDTSIEEITKKATPRYIIPLSTMGELRHASRVKILRIQSEEHVYPTMEDLWKFHPRYAMPKKTFTVGNVVVKRLQTIELKSHENGCITCSLTAIDKTVQIPMKQRGDFTIVEDGTSYTLQQVNDNFNLPQRVRFESNPAGMNSTDVLLISETRYDVLIACVTAGLYVEDEEAERRETLRTRDEDFTDISFIFLPRPISEESPLADTKFFTWLYDPDDPTCQVIMSRASIFELDRFKDMNVVINANSSSMSAVKEYSAENIYDYIKVHDFIEDYSGSSPPGKSPAASLGSPSATAPTTYFLHSGGATKAGTNPYTEEPTSRPKPESFSEILKHGLKTIKLKGIKSESEARNGNPVDAHKGFHTLPREAGSKIETQLSGARRQRIGSLPPLPTDGSVSEDNEYVEPDWKNQPENKISQRGRLPLPGEKKKGDQEIVQPLPARKVSPGGMYDLKMREEEKGAIAKLWPGPSPPADMNEIEKPPPRPPKPRGGQDVVRGQISAVGHTVPKCKVAVVRGQVVKVHGQSTSTKGQEGATKCKVDVVQGHVAEVQGQVPTSSAPGGPRRIKFPPPNGNLVPLSELTAEQLALLFKYFNMEKLAEQVKSNRIDGQFFETSLGRADFAVGPFFATEFQLKQIERIKNGQY